MCLELDEERFKPIETILTKIPSYLMKTDMLYSISYAKTHDIPIELIDKPGSGRLIHRLQYIPFRTRIKISCTKILTFIAYISLPQAIILYIWKKRLDSLNQYLHSDKIENSDIDTKTHINYDNLLMKNRDLYMANKLEKISQQFNNIIAIVGNAHLPGISALLMNSNIQFKIIPLKQYFTEQLTIRSIIDVKVHNIVIDFFVRMALYLELFIFLKTRLL